MRIRDFIKEGVVDSVKSSAKKFWHGTSGEISRERKWPLAYEKAKVAYRHALNTGDFDAIDKYSDLFNYFALLTGNATLPSFQNRLLRQKWTKQDFVEYVRQHYKDDLDRADAGKLQEAKAVWDKPNPKKKHKKLTPAKKAKAKARAKKAGRKYPNMVDNIWAAQLQEADEDVLPPISRDELKKKQQLRSKYKSIEDDWKKREQNQANIRKRQPGITKTSFGWTITRSSPDEYGDPIEADIVVYVSGEYEPASQGSQFEPGYPAQFHGIDIDWAEIDSTDPQDAPLTMEEKVALQLEFEEKYSSLYDRANEALLEEV